MDIEVDTSKEVLKRQFGGLTIFVLISTTIAVYILSGFVGLVLVQDKATETKAVSEFAFQIAESGIDYYRWHLAHDQADYWDGNPPGTPGPFVHDYLDKDGIKVGEFSLQITPPPADSTIVTVESSGSTTAMPGVVRRISARYGIPSLAQYAIAVDADVRLGTGTEVFGPIHSNGGIRFDGLAHNIVTSAQADYDDPDHSGGNEFGVHTHITPTDPLPPATTPVRTDVFEAGRDFPVPAIDFDGFDVDLAQMRTDAQADGIYYADSGVQGYHIVLKTTDLFDIYSVDSLVAAPPGCSSGQTGWGTWSINTETLLSSNVAFPNNGVIFVEDNVWVDGQIDGARITIGSGKFPENPLTNTNIITDNDLLYTNYDGTDVISLFAQQNHRAGLKSADTLRVDAAIVALNGSTGRFYYNSSCGTGYIRNSLTLYGMLASRLRYGYAYTGTPATGYGIRNLIYDGNLLYGPPPNFPLTSGNYEIVSWEEVMF